MGGLQTDQTLEALTKRGVKIVDPRQTYVGPEVSLDRVCSGVTLHPGTRVQGARTYLGADVQVGLQGPATLLNAVLGPRAVVDAGYVDGAVLFDEARIGWGGHVRPGTILEEQASTAHAVGLKHTILLSFVTLGSLINFCDCLMAGGTSRSDHSEVGSGFIHFNFTPWGTRGDKATASLIGDVARGVFLREPRIFLGGSAGLVGPGSVGFGAITGAGQVVRRPVPESTISVEPPQPVLVAKEPGRLDRAERRLGPNVRYIGQLVALQRFYQRVRLTRRPDDAVVLAAIENVELCISERVKRLSAFMSERGEPMPVLALDADAPCPLPLEGPHTASHLDWVRALTASQADAGVAWLSAIASAVVP